MAEKERMDKTRSHVEQEETKQVVVERVVGGWWWADVRELGNTIGPSCTRHSSQDTTPLLKGQPQCLSFRPSKLQHRPSFLTKGKHHGLTDREKREPWMARCARSKSSFVCKRVYVFVSVFWFLLFHLINQKFKFSKLALHATIISSSRCTRVMTTFIPHIFTFFIFGACMHRWQKKKKKKNRRRDRWTMEVFILYILFNESKYGA